MNCSVVWDQSTQELEVSWKKDNVDMFPDGERITSDDVNHFLTIRDLNFADAGKKILVFLKKYCFFFFVV